jgi:cytidylate kinase
MGEKKGIVMDGRDIGTTVFPNAELKIFMTADMLIRVERRFLEMQNKNPNITFKEVQSNLQMRDRIDSTREVSPLKMATDAILLDNSTLTMEQQLEFALQLIQEKLK